MRISYLQANSLFELSAKYGLPVHVLYQSIKKSKGIIKGVVIYENILLNQYEFKRRFEIDQQGNIAEDKARIKRKAPVTGP